MSGGFETMQFTCERERLLPGPKPRPTTQDPGNGVLFFVFFLCLFSKADACEALHQLTPPPHPTTDGTPLNHGSMIDGWVGRGG